MNIIEIPSDHEMFSKEFSGVLDNFIYDEVGIIIKTGNRIDIGLQVFYEREFLGTQIHLIVLNNKAIKDVYYEISYSDKNNDGIEVMCNKNEQEFLDIGHDVAQLVARIIVYIMNTPREKILKQKKSNKVKESDNVENKKKQSAENKIYLLDEIVDYVNENGLTIQSSGTHKIQCPCWSVRGHYRHYKNGNVVFIKSHEKGKEKGKNKPEDKVYVV